MTYQIHVPRVPYRGSLFDNLFIESSETNKVESKALNRINEILSKYARNRIESLPRGTYFAPVQEKFK